MSRAHVTEVRCKSLLNRGTVGFAEYTLNAYLGCAFGCSFCYVPVVRDRRGQESPAPWGGWVQVKVNAPDVLRRELLRVDTGARIAIGTATDSWQPIEKRYGISRAILQELAYYPNRVSITTRSPLLLRDMDILAAMSDVVIGVSVATFDERARRVFEPYAPAVAGREALVRRLIGAGLAVRLFWCPILYGVSDSAPAVRAYLERAAALGVRQVVCDTLNYTQALAGPHMRLLRQYREVAGVPTAPSLPRAALAAEIARSSRRLGLRCAL
ncbi:MAG: hypothetical protein IT208_16615 [Chthonomonadales bacterium]|nr:hypothetical protein [Chthonomonadales bacterium]